MDYDVHSVIASCFMCQSCDKTAQMCLAPLQPFQKVAIDIAGPFVGATHDFAITIVDYYSKRPEVAFTSNVKVSSKITELPHTQPQGHLFLNSLKC